ATYVIYLSLRGQAEFAALKSTQDDEDSDAVEVARGRVKSLVVDWLRAENVPSVTVPVLDEEAKAAAIRRGYELFLASGRGEPPDRARTSGVISPARPPTT